MSSSPRQKQSAAGNEFISVVKYSLPELLAELKHERASGVFAMEKMQQADIGNLFKKTQRQRRGKSEQ